MTLSIERMLEEWRQRRRLDYEQLGTLIEHGMNLTRAGDCQGALNVLDQILRLVHEMQNNDTKRFFINGMTRTPELKDDGDGC